MLLGAPTSYVDVKPILRIVVSMDLHMYMYMLWGCGYYEGVGLLLCIQCCISGRLLFEGVLNKEGVYLRQCSAYTLYCTLAGEVSQRHRNL